MIDQKYLDAYCDAIREAEERHRADRGYDYLKPSMISIDRGRRFARIVMDNGTQRHVHAFVDLTNGDVIKSGGWKAPQKSRDGVLAVRFNLVDDASREECFAKIDPHGGYLYDR
jgi:hypothetical protein